MCTYFKIETDVVQNLIDNFFLSEKKYGGTGLISEKKVLYAKLNERAEAATSSYSAATDFLQYIYSALVAKNHQKVRSRCLVHVFSFTDIF